ncbi:aminopeptidase P2-like [Camellia sinensis]|uniref:aminopeptidase P2-like n=1 Tax=Camellia sinensis TaxID=4442 RepID=UPI0010362209|nr:aminopeptidase P2-like [Camellia sinensis]
MKSTILFKHLGFVIGILMLESCPYQAVISSWQLVKGHIALDQAVFPENTPGFVLDAFARSFLWKIGLDYRHGTGHGVQMRCNS